MNKHLFTRRRENSRKPDYRNGLFFRKFLFIFIDFFVNHTQPDIFCAEVEEKTILNKKLPCHSRTKVVKQNYFFFLLESTYACMCAPRRKKSCGENVIVRNAIIIYDIYASFLLHYTFIMCTHTAFTYIWQETHPTRKKSQDEQRKKKNRREKKNSTKKKKKASYL